MGIDLLNNGLMLGGLRFVSLAKGFARYRNPYRRRAWSHRVEFYERAWKEAAEQLGASWRMIGPEIIEITLGDFRTRVKDNSSAIDDPVTLDLLSDKILTYKILAEQGLCVPRHVEFTLRKIAAARKFLSDIAGGINFRGGVVKPVRGTGGGRGITAGIRTESQLARAAANAAAYCKDLLIEEQIEGENYRLLYLDGELIDAFIRRPPTVIGDGKLTISQLVRQANDDRLKHKSERSQVLLTVDMDMKRTLAKNDLSLSSMPTAGTRITLKTVVNENCGDDNSTVTHALSRSIIDDGARAVRALGIRLGGVDIITRDASLPLAESGGVMIEVNAPPNFYYHYHKKDGVFPVALYVLKRLIRDHSENA